MRYDGAVAGSVNDSRAVAGSDAASKVTTPRTDAPGTSPSEPTLSKAKALPLYLQLYGILRGRMLSGEWEAGAVVPPESELMEAFGVSRITVRAALDQLVHDGLVERHRGRGSFVREVPLESRSCMTSFTESTLASGRRPTARMVAVRRGTAAALDLTAAPFAVDEPLVLIERVRLIDDEPAALMRSAIPARLVPGLSEESFADEGREQSLLYVLERRFGLPLDTGEETIVPTAITSPYAEALGLEPGRAVVMKTCAMRDRSGAFALYEEAFWNAPQKQLLQRIASRS